MHSFEHIHATDLRTAIFLLSEPQTVAMAGGTDLLGELKRRIKTFKRLVNLKTLQDLKKIENGKDLRIGALVTLNEIGQHPAVLKKYPMLCEAVALVATPQLRNMGTLGGNLCQRPRCWYYRNPLFHCWLKGGKKCFASEGENRHHAILGAQRCHAVHPSDLAPVLMALGASAIIQGLKDKSEISIEDLYAQPKWNRRQMTILNPTDLILQICIPSAQKGSHGIYLKAMDRRAWSFALVSVAAVLSNGGGLIKKAHLIMGGVAPIPWRAKEAEKVLEGQQFSRELVEAAAEEAMKKAQPLRDNGYKVQLAKGLIKQALTFLCNNETRRRTLPLSPAGRGRGVRGNFLKNVRDKF